MDIALPCTSWGNKCNLRSIEAVLPGGSPETKRMKRQPSKLRTLVSSAVPVLCQQVVIFLGYGPVAHAEFGSTNLAAVVRRDAREECTNFAHLAIPQMEDTYTHTHGPSGGNAKLDLTNSNPVWVISEQQLRNCELHQL